jgi:hypothetical protein
MIAYYINPQIVDGIIYFDINLEEAGESMIRLSGSSFTLGFDEQEAVDRAVILVQNLYPELTLTNIQINYPNGNSNIDWIG